MPNPFDNLGELMIRIVGDYSQLQQDLDNAAKAAKDAGEKIASSLNEAGDKGAGGLKDIREALNDLRAPTQSLITDTGVLGVEFSTLAAIGATTAAALALIATEAVNLVKEFGAAAEKTQNLSDKLNLSVQDTRHLSEMAEVAGVSIGVLDRASARLATALEDSGGAGKKVALALDSMGIAGSNSGEVLKKLLEHLASIPDATQRIAEATKVMGRGAVELEPLLKNYQSLSDAIDSLGGTIDSELIAKLAAADDASDKLGIAWRHLKENLAGLLAPAVTVAFDVLAKLFAGSPNNSLEKQLMDVNEQLIQIQTNVSRIPNRGGLFGPDTSDLERNTTTSTDQQQRSLELRKEELELTIEATKRSKEYNDTIDKINRDAQIYANEAKARAKEFAKEQDDLFRAANEGFRKDAEDINAQQEAWRQLTADLKFFHVELSDPAVDDAKERLARLTVAANNHWIKTKDLTQAQADYNKVFGFDFPTYLENAIKLTDQLDEKFQHFAQSAAHVKDVLRGFESSAGDVLAALNAGIPVDPTRAGRAKGTPLGDSLLGLGINRDDDNLKSVSLLNQLLDAQNATLKDVEAGWTKVSAVIATIGRTDLPKAIEEYDRIIAKMVELGAAEERIDQVRRVRLSAIIQEKSLRGDSATAEMIQLEQLRLKQEQLIEQSQRWGKLYIDLIGDFKHSFDLVGRSIADNIVDGKNWADVWHSLVKSIEKMFLETLIGSAFKALGNEIIRVTGLAGTLAKVFGIGGSAASSAASGAAGAAGTAGSAASSAGGVTGAAAGTVSSLSNVIGIAGAGIAAASGIVNGIQNARMENLLSGIELSTRATKEQLVGGTQTVLLTWLPKLDLLVGILGALNGMQAALLDVKAALAQNSGFLTDLITSGSGSTSGAVLATRPAPTTGSATGGDPIAEIQENTRVVADAVQRRGPNVLNPPGGGSASNQASSGDSLYNPNGPGFRTAEIQTLAQIYAKAKRDLGLSTSEFDANVQQTITEGIKNGWIAAGTTIQDYLLGGGTKTSAGQFSSATGYEALIVKDGFTQLIKDSALNQYKLGNIDKSTFEASVQAKVAAEQLSYLAKSVDVAPERGVTPGYQGGYSPSVGYLPGATNLAGAAGPVGYGVGSSQAQFQTGNAWEGFNSSAFLKDYYQKDKDTRLAAYQQQIEEDQKLLKQAQDNNIAEGIAYYSQQIKALQLLYSRLAAITVTDAPGIVKYDDYGSIANLMGRINQIPVTPFIPSPDSFFGYPTLPTPGLNPGATPAGSPMMSGTSAGFGVNSVNMTNYIYTNDPQVVANKLTDSLWQSGVKTR